MQAGSLFSTGTAGKCDDDDEEEEEVAEVAGVGGAGELAGGGGGGGGGGEAPQRVPHAQQPSAAHHSAPAQGTSFVPIPAPHAPSGEHSCEFD